MKPKFSFYYSAPVSCAAWKGSCSFFSPKSFISCSEPDWAIYKSWICIIWPRSSNSYTNEAIRHMLGPQSQMDQKEHFQQASVIISVVVSHSQFCRITSNFTVFVWVVRSTCECILNSLDDVSAAFWLRTDTMRGIIWTPTPSNVINNAVHYRYS